MADHGARAAAGSCAAYRRPPANRQGRPGISTLGRRLQSGIARTGLGRRSQHADRHPLGHERRRRDSQTSGGIGGTRAGRHSGAGHVHGRGIDAGDAHRADRVPTRAALLRDPSTAAGIGQWAAAEAFAPSFGLELRPVNVGVDSEVERAIAKLASEANGGIIVTSSGPSVAHRDVIIALRRATVCRQFMGSACSPSPAA